MSKGISSVNKAGENDTCYDYIEYLLNLLLVSFVIFWMIINFESILSESVLIENAAESVLSESVLIKKGTELVLFEFVMMENWTESILSEYFLMESGIKSSRQHSHERTDVKAFVIATIYFWSGLKCE